MVLGIPQVTIERVEIKETEIHLHVKTVSKTEVCPNCHRPCQQIHQNNPVRVIRDLPLSGKQCYLHISSRRFWCPHCNLPFPEDLDFVDPYRNCTKRYEVHIYELVRQNNVSYVRALEGLSYEVVEGIFLREAKARIPLEPFENLRKLGIDEISERKGKKSFDVIFYNLETGKPVEALQGRTKEQVVSYFKTLSEDIKQKIEEVCIDMWRPYAKAVLETLPHSELVVDRFHIMQSVNKDLKELKNKRKKELPEEAQGCHYPLLKNEDDLTKKQEEILKNVYEADAVLKRAHQLKEQFRAIFETTQAMEEARKKLQKWICKAYKHEMFSGVITNMKTWLTPVLKYFVNRTTNGPSEGINNKVKLIKRRGYGFRNFGNFRLRILTAFL